MFNCKPLASVLTVLTVLILTGCAASRDVRLPDEARPRIKTIEPVLVAEPGTFKSVGQPPPNYSAGLLVGLLAEVAHSSAANGALERGKDVDLHEAIKAAMSAELGKSGDVRLRHPLRAIAATETARTGREIMESSEADVVVFWTFQPLYLTTNQFRMAATARMYARDPDLLRWRKSPDASKWDAEGNVLYRKDFEVMKYGVRPFEIVEALRSTAADMSRKVIADLQP